MVGGAGYMAGKKIEQGREADAYRDQQIADLQMQNAQLQQAQMQQTQMQQAPMAAPPPPPPPSAGGISQDRIEQLKQLGELHEQGILTDEEFAAQKKALLGG